MKTGLFDIAVVVLAMDICVSRYAVLGRESNNLSVWSTNTVKKIGGVLRKVYVQ